MSDCCTAQAEHVHSTCTPVTFNIGNLVLAQVQVQSHASHDSIAKLSYSIWGPFSIADQLLGGAYSLSKIGNPHGPLFKFPTEAIQPCPPRFLTCDPTNAPDLCYLNLDHIPTPNFLAKPFNLKLYNKVWFSHNVAAPPPKFDYTSQPDFLIDIPMDNCFSTMTESTTELPATPSIPIKKAPALATITPAHLAVAISTSLDKLFFIYYLLPGTLCPQWYLVQVNMDCTAQDPCCSTFLLLVNTTSTSSAIMLTTPPAVTSPVNGSQFGTNTLLAWMTLLNMENQWTSGPTSFLTTVNISHGVMLSLWPALCAVCWALLIFFLALVTFTMIVGLNFFNAVQFVELSRQRFRFSP